MKHERKTAQRSTAEWQAADAAHFLHPFTDFGALAQKGSRIIEKGEGIYLWDTEGRKILDAMSGLWCVNVGYGQRTLIDAATRQLEQLPFYNAFFQTATPPAIELAELLATLTPPQFKHVFFSGSGSEGNDTVVRMVRRYWDLLGQPERRIVISRNGNQPLGMITHAATPDDLFQKQIGKLAELAIAIRVVPQVPMPNTPSAPAGNQDSVVEAPVKEVNF